MHAKELPFPEVARNRSRLWWCLVYLTPSEASFADRRRASNPPRWRRWTTTSSPLGEDEGIAARHLPGAAYHLKAILPRKVRGSKRNSAFPGSPWRTASLVLLRDWPQPRYDICSIRYWRMRSFIPRTKCNRIQPKTGASHVEENLVGRGRFSHFCTRAAGWEIKQERQFQKRFRHVWLRRSQWLRQRERGRTTQQGSSPLK